MEDLGGGLKASFWAELDITPVRSTTLNQAVANNGEAFTGTPFNGQQYVALSGGFGDLLFGTPNSPVLTTFNANAHSFGTALGSGYSGGFGRFGTAKTSGINQYIGGPSSGGRIIRQEKTALYKTPVMNGFKAQVEYSFQNDKSTTNTSNDYGYNSVTLDYSNGPLNVVTGTAKTTAGTANAVAGTGTGAAATDGILTKGYNSKWSYTSGNYNFGATTIYAGFSSTKSNDATTPEDSKSSNIAAKYALNGQVDLMVNTLSRKSNLAAPTSAATSKLNAVGADYKLSKNTIVYYRYEKLNGLTSIAANESQTTNAIGLRMGF